MANLKHSLDILKRHYRPVVAFVVVSITVVAFVLMVERTAEEEFFSKIATSSELSELSETSEIGSTGLERSAPQVLRIPAIGLEAEFEGPLGLNADRSVKVPESYEEVGWYKFGPTPGEIGPAVVLGHVDSYEGPAIFFSLGQIKLGDEIYIDRADGTTVVFEVTELERHEQSDFPTQEVYGDIDHAGLRLITCTGIYDRSVLRYTHNLIVYAKMIEEVEGE